MSNYTQLYKKDPVLAEKLLDEILPAIMPTITALHGKEIMGAMAEIGKLQRQIEWNERCR